MFYLRILFPRMTASELRHRVDNLEHRQCEIKAAVDMLFHCF